MNLIHAIPLADFTGGVITTIISVIICFAIIIGLILYIKNSKKRKNMVHNREKKNDHPEKRK